MVLTLGGGGVCPQPKDKKQSEEMTMAPAGLIKQTIVKDPLLAKDWAQDNTIIFNIQLLTASVFEALLGMPAPPTSVTPAMYKKLGFPFFKMYEEKSGIKGNFKNIKSVAELDKKKGKKCSPDDDESLNFPIVAIDPSKIPLTPVAEMIQELQKMNVVSEF